MVTSIPPEIPLNISYIRREYPELLKEAFEKRPFLGWYGAVCEAGLDYHAIPHELQEYLECPICGLSTQLLRYLMDRKHEVYIDSGKVYDIKSETFRIRTGRNLLEVHDGEHPHWDQLLARRLG